MQLKPLGQGEIQGWMAYQRRYMNPFFKLLKDPLLAWFNHRYKNAKLSGTQQEGLISLLLKQDRDGKYKEATSVL